MSNIYEKLYSMMNEEADLEGVTEDISGVEPVSDEDLEKKVENVCQNFLEEYSIQVNNKNHMIMKTTKLSKAELDRIAARFNEINSAVAASSSLSPKYQMIAYYLSATENLSQTEAEFTIDRLMSGVDSLTEKYQAALNDGWNPSAEVAQMTANMTLEQRYDFLVNAIAIVQSVNAQTLGDDADQVKESVEQAIETLKAQHGAATEDVCNTLQTLLSELLESSSLMLQGADQAKELMQAAGKGQTAAVDFAAASYDDRLYKYQMALAAWIEFENDQLESFPENTIPEAVGVSIAAGIEEAKIIQEVSLGRKCVEWATTALKILGGVALACFLGYISIVGLTIASASFFVAGVLIMGTSTAAIIIAGLAALLITCGMCDTVLDVCQKVMMACSDAYDYVVDKLCNVVYPKIKEIAVRFVKWVRSLFSKQDEHEPAVE